MTFGKMLLNLCTSESTLCLARVKPWFEDSPAQKNRLKVNEVFRVKGEWWDFGRTPRRTACLWLRNIMRLMVFGKFRNVMVLMFFNFNFIFPLASSVFLVDWSVAWDYPESLNLNLGTNLDVVSWSLTTNKLFSTISFYSNIRKDISRVHHEWIWNFDPSVNKNCKKYKK